MLRRGVLGRQWRSGFKRQHGRRRSLALAFEQLGDTEIQQFYLPIFADQDIGRLNVAMDYQIGMGMRHRRQHIDEEFDPLVNAEPAPVAVMVDRLAFDMLNYKIGMTGGGYTCVQQFCNVDVREPPQDRAFPLKPLLRDLVLSARGLET